MTDEDTVADLLELLACVIAASYNTDPEVYRERVHDVVEALTGRGTDPLELLIAIEKLR